MRYHAVLEVDDDNEEEVEVGGSLWTMNLALTSNLIMSHFKCICNSVVLLEYLKYKKKIYEVSWKIMFQMKCDTIIFYNILIYCLLVPLWRGSKFI